MQLWKTMVYETIDVSRLKSLNTETLKRGEDRPLQNRKIYIVEKKNQRKNKQTNKKKTGNVLRETSYRECEKLLYLFVGRIVFFFRSNSEAREWRHKNLDPPQDSDKQTGLWRKLWSFLVFFKARKLQSSHKTTVFRVVSLKANPQTIL